MYGIAQSPEHMRNMTLSVTLNQEFVHFIAATAGFYEKIEVLEILKGEPCERVHARDRTDPVT